MGLLIDNCMERVVMAVETQRMLWKIAEPDPLVARDLARVLGISGIVARLLVNRGISDPGAAKRFLQPRMEDLEDPAQMAGLTEAVERIRQAMERQEKILIYGDYDVDGTTAVVVLRKALETLGAQTTYYIPKRLVDGYGMKANVVEQAAAAGVKLIISVDTGIKAFDVVEKASQLGLDCIITDHHLPENGLPKALAVLNPKRPDCPYPDKHLCGVGVAFKLVQALFKDTGWEKYLRAFLKIVAIGTIADVVPLVGENRIFAKLGLEGLKDPVNPGLKSLIEIAGLEGKPITSSDVGFRLAPRINAVGRMGGGEQAVELFASTDQERSRLLATEMDQLNRDRQQIEEKILRLLEARFESDPAVGHDPVVVIDGEGWHRGVIGIVATKIIERFHKPALVISKEDGIGYGSGRSPKEFHLLRALESCRDLFDRFGGHAQAAGFQLPASHIDELRRRVNAYAKSALGTEAMLPVLEIDAELRLSDVEPNIYEQIERLSPFGQANPQPIFAARGLSLIAEPRLLKGRHLKFRVEQDGKAIDAVAWNMAHQHLPLMRSGRPISMAFTLAQNAYQFMNVLQLVVKDIQFP